MRPFFVHGEMVRRAVALQILEPEDIKAVDGAKLKAPDLLRALQEAGYLRVPVVEALGRLVEVRPVTISGDMTAHTRRPSMGAGTVNRTGASQLNVGGTLSTSDEGGAGLNVADRTVEPAEDGGSGGTGLNVSGNTLDPAEDPGDINVEKSTQDGLRLNATSATVDPEGETNVMPRGSTLAPYGAGGTVHRGGTTLNVGTGTLAPDGQTTLNTGGTLAPDEGGGLNVASGTAANELNVSGDTLDAEKKERTLIPEEPQPVIQKAEDWDGLVDLTALDPARRQTLQSAAFARIALRFGYVTRGQIDAAYADPGLRVEDYFTQNGLVDPAKAMEIFELCQTKRPVCWNCYAILPSAESNCRECGKRQVALTLSTAQKKRQGIEGFPDEGGTFGEYELVKRVAEGGMGVVYRARQLKLNRVVALKVMRGGNMASRARRRRFLQEAEAAAGLKHPCIVPVHEIDEAAGYPFYTMDFVEGESLDRYVLEKKPSPREIVQIMVQLGGAVQHFHLNGILHRDLKPDNILVGADAVPRIIDFGIAKKLGEEKKGATMEGAVLGTPHYMSPEQAAGRVSEVDTRTDVYALGTILYELLTGAPPWKELSQAALVVAIQEQDPPAVRSLRPDVDADLDAIIQKAMAKERERRYQSAAELTQDLERYLNNEPIQARPASIAYRVQKYVRRHLPQVVATAIVVVTIGTVIGYSQVQRAAFRIKINGLLAQARDEKTGDLNTRLAIVEQVLGQDSGNGEALTLKKAIEDKRTEGERIAEAKRQAEKEKLEAEARTAKLESERKAELARAEEKENAAKNERLRREKQAADMFAAAQTKSATNKAGAFFDLMRALVVLPDGPSDTRGRIENAMIAVALDLAKTSIAANEASQASLWIENASNVESAKAHQGEIAAVQADLTALITGQKDVEQARAVLANKELGAERFVKARSLLEGAIKKGTRQDLIADDLNAARSGCAQRVKELIADGQKAVERGEAARAIAIATEAKGFDPNDTAVQTLLDKCENQVRIDAQKRAAQLFATDAAAAIAALDEAIKTVKNPEIVDRLTREKKARERLVAGPEFAKQVAFLPDLPALGCAGVCIDRFEVTNAAFKDFVDKGGYNPKNGFFTDREHPDRSTPAALVATFVDKTGRPGPRVWENGGFGEVKNSNLPVRGITIHEARAFARWLTQEWNAKGDKGHWRLPSDHEWEVAAGWSPQTGAIQAYPWGDAFDSRKLVCAKFLPEEVGHRKDDCSPLQVYDMAGNVAEWVERQGGAPGIKGASFAADAGSAPTSALIKQTGTPVENPPRALLERIGFRLVLED